MGTHSLVQGIVNPIDVASTAYQPNRKFWTGLLKSVFPLFWQIIKQMDSLWYYLSQSDVFHDKK